MTQTPSLKREAEEHAAKLAEHVKSSASSTAEQHAGAVRNSVAEQVEDTADAAHAAAAQFDPASLQAEAIRHVADRVESLGAQIRSSDVASLTKNVSDFARHNPVLFIGAAAAVGFAATRFLKARGDTASGHIGMRSDDDVWGTERHDASIITELNREHRDG